MTAPQMVGSIIGIEWLAAQMGLPVDVVRERIEQARKEDEWNSTRSTASMTTAASCSTSA